KLRALGYRGFLVGEPLMRADNPEKKLREFVTEAGVYNSLSSVRVKICGITNIDDARAALRFGADMLGFNFYRPSPRYIEPHVARTIVNGIRSEIEAAQRAASMVGVFVNETIEQVLSISDQVNLDSIQLHGDETPEYCGTLKRLSPDRFIIKAIPADAAHPPEAFESYGVDAIMIDASDEKLRGGTGKVVDLNIARQVSKSF